MKDIIFYPLIGLLVLAMAIAAMYQGWTQPKCGPFGGAEGPADYSLIILNGGDLCRMEGAQGYELDLDNEVPFKQRHRRIPPAMLDELRSHLQELVASGVIRPSHSPWASNVV